MIGGKNMKKAMIMLGMLGCLALPYNVLAAEAGETTEITNEINNSCRLYASYSDGIPAQNGDKFYMEYEDENGIQNNMVVDVSAAEEVPLDIQMESGDYNITNITYVGYNSEINRQGYCVTTEFSVGENAINEIHLGIGTVQAERIDKEYRYTLFVQNGAFVNSSEREEVETPTEGANDIQETEENTDFIENSEKENSIKKNDNTDKSQEDKNTELKKDTDEKYHITVSGLLVRNIPVFIIVIALIVIVILKRREDKKCEE